MFSSVSEKCMIFWHPYGSSPKGGPIVLQKKFLGILGMSRYTTPMPCIWKKPIFKLRKNQTCNNFDDPILVSTGLKLIDLFFVNQALNSPFFNI